MFGLCRKLQVLVGAKLRFVFQSLQMLAQLHLNVKCQSDGGDYLHNPFLWEVKGVIVAICCCLRPRQQTLPAVNLFAIIQRHQLMTIYELADTTDAIKRLDVVPTVATQSLFHFCTFDTVSLTSKCSFSGSVPLFCRSCCRHNLYSHCLTASCSLITHVGV